ncbi:MAG: FtsW/RodA/SpoVE family cell cycle protein [Actinomycetota bacterium]|nr:FtsW/RodA/SpoVE family cell cycle protein [Actinomycetota bacterium]
MRRRNAELAMMILAGVIAVGANLLVDFAHSSALPAWLPVYALLVVGTIALTTSVMRRFAPYADPLLLPVAIALSGIGFAMIRRLDPTLAGPQLAWFVIGLVAFCATLIVVRDHRRLEAFRYTLMVVGLGLLLLPLAPGVGHTINSARLWVRIGGLNFQPAELAKVVLATFLAAFLAQKKELLTIGTTKVGPWVIPAPRHFGPLILAWGLSLAVMVFERDLGSSVLFFSLFLATLYVATERAAYGVAGLGLFTGGTLFAYHSFSHVQTRVDIWLHVWDRIDGRGYQLAQSLFALGTGGLTGAGIGQGQPKLIPFASTDFIFSAIGEELGFFGAVAVLTAFGILVARGLHIALRARDTFSTLLAAGLTTVLGLQTFLIIGGVTRLIPLTGITLPFVSYGGSSILANFILLALLLRISDGEGRSA